MEQRSSSSSRPNDASVDSSSPLLAENIPNLDTNIPKPTLHRKNMRVNGLSGVAWFLRPASVRRMMREPLMMVRETVAEQLEGEQSHRAYSKPVVILDLIRNLAFIMVSLIVLCISINEKPNAPLQIWICGYCLQGIVHMICVSSEFRKRYRQYLRYHQQQKSPQQQQQQPNRPLAVPGPYRTFRSSGESLGDNSPADEEIGGGNTGFAKHLESMNRMFSFIWWIVGFYWITTGDQVLIQEAPKLYWLSVVFLAFDVLFVVFSVALTYIIGSAVCCCLNCIIAILYAVATEVFWHKILRLIPLYMLLIAEFSRSSFANAAVDKDTYVLSVDSSNFTQVVQQHSFIVIEFYATWCGHCKRLAPEYERAAAILKTHEPAIVLAKINANEETNKALAGQFNVRGYPTLKIFEKGGLIVRDFKGPRDTEGIVSYLKKQVGPPSIEITSVEEGRKLVDETDLLVVGLFSSYESEEFRNFISLANELRGMYEFRHTLFASFLPTKSSTFTAPAIRVFKKFEESFNDLKGFEVEFIKNFLHEVSVPSVVLLNKDPAQRKFVSQIFANPQVSKVFLFLDSGNKGTEDVKAVFSELAKEHKSKGLRFLIADTEYGKDALQYFGVRKDKLPSIAIQDKDEHKYILEEAYPGKIRMWFKDYFDGKLSKFDSSKSKAEYNYELVKDMFIDTIGDVVFRYLKNGHVFVEVLLVIVIAYLLLQKSYQPEKRPLTKQEIDQLCDDWTPEPLHPPLTKDMEDESPILESGAGPRAIINGEEVINLSTANYLGLMGDKGIVEACTKTLETYGVGACGPRGFYGTIDVHLDCEAKISQFMGTPDSILYSYGLATAASTIPAFCKRGDLILADEGVNWSIQNGLYLSRSTVKLFKHNDMSSLEALLEDNHREDQRKRKALNRRFIVVEAIYQNSGKMAPLLELIHLKEKYRFRLLVDESNSIGVLGNTGRGLTEHYQVSVAKVDIITAAMGHALASVGGFCTGSAKVVDHQRLSGAGYCFSASLPPYVATASIAAFERLEKNPILLQTLHNNITIFRQALQGISGLTIESHPMSPLVFLQLKQGSGSFKEDRWLLQTIADQMLRKESVLVSVTKRSVLDKCKLPAALTISVSAAHTEADLLAAAESLLKVAALVLESSCNGTDLVK